MLREADFLTLARACGDLERLVGREGLEGALGVLLRPGVYVRVDEFKGRRPIVRGGHPARDPRAIGKTLHFHTLAVRPGAGTSARSPSATDETALASGWRDAR